MEKVGLLKHNNCWQQPSDNIAIIQPLSSCLVAFAHNKNGKRMDKIT